MNTRNIKCRKDFCRKGRRLSRDCAADVSYMDTVIGMFALMLLIVLIINVFSFLTLKQNLDYVSSQLAEIAASDGAVNERVPALFQKLCADFGWDSSEVSYTFEGSDFMPGNADAIQYGNLIRVEVRCKTTLNGTGIFTLPLNVSSSADAISGKYRKN